MFIVWVPRFHTHVPHIFASFLLFERSVGEWFSLQCARGGSGWTWIWLTYNLEHAYLEGYGEILSLSLPGTQLCASCTL